MIAAVAPLQNNHDGQLNMAVQTIQY